EVVLTLSRLEVLDRVAQCGTRHDWCILIKEATQPLSIDPLARFAQRPANGLVDQVMAIGQQNHREPVEIVRLATWQEVLAADHGNPALPQQVALDELVERCSVAIQQITYDDRTAAHIDEVPVVHIAGVADIGLIDQLQFPVVEPPDALPRALAHDDERDKPMLMNRAAQQRKPFRWLKS